MAKDSARVESSMVKVFKDEIDETSEDDLSASLASEVGKYQDKQQSKDNQQAKDKNLARRGVE